MLSAALRSRGRGSAAARTPRSSVPRGLPFAVGRGAMSVGTLRAKSPLGLQESRRHILAGKVCRGHRSYSAPIRELALIRALLLI
eukprot:scaffold702_cov119-Isochrysis_galbana.AAC.9